MTINQSDVKKLYALSAGMCNICKLNLFENDVHIGEMAHVIPRSDNGPRSYEPYDGNNRDVYDNLILLCANHHIEVDRMQHIYPANRLYEIKHQHENFVRLRLNTDSKREQDIRSLSLLMQFMPFVRLPGYIYWLPSRFNIDFLTVQDAFGNFMLDMPHCYPFEDKTLTGVFQDFISNHQALRNWLTGCWNDMALFGSVEGVGVDAYISYMNKRSFSHEDRIIIDSEIEKGKENFERSYFDLLTYLRSYYPEVNLDSYLLM